MSTTPAGRRPTVVLVGGIYHADADKVLRQQATVVALERPSPADIAAIISPSATLYLRSSFTVSM